VHTCTLVGDVVAAHIAGAGPSLDAVLAAVAVVTVTMVALVGTQVNRWSMQSHTNVRPRKHATNLWIKCVPRHRRQTPGPVMRAFRVDRAPGGVLLARRASFLWTRGFRAEKIGAANVGTG
jgi:hypothetical protein